MSLCKIYKAGYFFPHFSCFRMVFVFWDAIWKWELNYTFILGFLDAIFFLLNICKYVVFVLCLWKKPILFEYVVNCDDVYLYKKLHNYRFTGIVGHELKFLSWPSSLEHLLSGVFGCVYMVVWIRYRMRSNFTSHIWKVISQGQHVLIIFNI